MLGLRYSSAIDMWSLGCILFELFQGTPLFTGLDELEQMNQIIQFRGLPPRSLLVAATRRAFFFDNDYRPILTSDCTPGSIKILDRLKDISSKKKLQENLSGLDDFASFIEHCLEWRPEARLTPSLAIQHPWITHGILEI
jgi:dual specificity tyrosine-phosphorylation-regulated kinase 2/3/4